MLPLQEGPRARSVGRFAILYYGCYTIDRQRAALNFVDRKRSDMNFYRPSDGRSVSPTKYEKTAGMIARDGGTI